jgi:hypothetical protein
MVHFLKKILFFTLLSPSLAHAAYLNQVQVSNFPAVQAVSQNSPPWSFSLPSGASTAANQVSILGAVDQLEGYVDGVEGLLTTANSNWTSLLGYTDQLEGYVDGLESLIGTTNSTLSTIATNTTGIATAANQTTANSSLSTIATNTTGASTAANQTAANTKLDSIISNTSSLQLQSGANTFLDKTSSGSLVNVNDAVTVNTNGAGMVGFQITGTFVKTIVFEATNDGVNWSSMTCLPRSGNAASFTQTTNAILGKCETGAVVSFRARISASTSGTAVVTLTASAANTLNNSYQLSASNNITTAAQSGTWTVQPGNTANTTPWYVTHKGSFSNITTATTTTVKSGAGVLKRVCYGTVANGSSAQLYDNTAGSGTTISLITPPNGSAPVCLPFDLSFATGLTIVTTGTSNITVVYE